MHGKEKVLFVLLCQQLLSVQPPPLVREPCGLVHRPAVRRLVHIIFSTPWGKAMYSLHYTSTWSDSTRNPSSIESPRSSPSLPGSFSRPSMEATCACHISWLSFGYPFVCRWFNTAFPSPSFLIKLQSFMIYAKLNASCVLVLDKINQKSRGGRYD